MWIFLLFSLATVSSHGATNYKKMRLFKLVRNNQVILKEAGPIPQTNDYVWDKTGNFKKVTNPLGDTIMFDLSDGKLNSMHEVSECYSGAYCRIIKSAKFDNRGNVLSASRCVANRRYFQWRSTCETVTAKLCGEIKANLSRFGKFEKCVPGFDDEKLRSVCPNPPKTSDKEAQKSFIVARKILQSHQSELEGMAKSADKLAINMAKASVISGRTGFMRYLPLGLPFSFRSKSDNTTVPQNSDMGEFHAYMWGLAKAHSMCHYAAIIQ
jgi:hypothetical protein